MPSDLVAEMLLNNMTNIQTCRLDMKTCKDGTHISLSSIPAITDMSPMMKRALLTYLQNALRALDPAVGDRVEGSNKWHTFSAYRMTKTSYIFSFITHPKPDDDEEEDDDGMTEAESRRYAHGVGCERK